MKNEGFAKKIAVRALLYMLYQSSLMDSRVGTSTMVGWTSASKPTILKEMKRLESLGLVNKVEIKHRPNAVSFEFYVTEKVKDSYELNQSKHSYDVYKRNIFGGH